MPYIGNTAGNRFVASKTATQFSGNGSAVDFTLDHSVSSPEDILVSVDGVIQEPTVAYGIVNGTTLRFTAAPSNNSGNNIFVYYLFRTVATVDHPATSALSATSGTFSGNLVIPDAGNIGSASDTDAIAISSGGVVTFSQKPVFSAGGVGKVLQVVQTVIAKSTITTSSATFTSTGKSLAITPTASTSRILIQVCGGGGHAPYVNQNCISTIYRGSTNLSSDGLESIGNSTAGLSMAPHNIVFLDSPNTTSATTYEVYYRSEPTKPNVYFNLGGGAGADFTITLTELAPN